MDDPLVAEKDYLTEFLDPRVYDSSGAKTPVSTPSGSAFNPSCRVCSAGTLGPCSNCAGESAVSNGISSGALQNELFLRIKQEITDADLMAGDLLVMGGMDAFEALTLGNTPSMNADDDVDAVVDPFIRFDDNSDYLYTRPQDMEISESGSPSETVITRATSTASLNVGMNALSAGVPTRNYLEFDSLAPVVLSGALPVSILDEHDETRKELAKIKFGNPNMNPCPSTINVPDPATVLDFLPETMLQMQYRLEVLDLPLHSRVETQIKLRFRFSPAPKELLLHVPQDLISKNKFCLANPVEKLPLALRKNMLFMDTYVLTSDLQLSCRVCPRCIKREQKRALRLKGTDAHTGDDLGDAPVKNEPRLAPLAHSSSFQNPWENESMLKKAIIYNCKEIVSFPPPSGLPTDQAKLLNFSARIICYCRHHKEAEGFKLLVVVRDYTGAIKGKCVSGPIMIMDRKKNLSSASRTTLATLNTNVNSNNVSVNNVNLNGSNGRASNGRASASNTAFSDTSLNPSDLTSLHPLLPNLIDDLTSDSAARGLKRKKMSYDDLYHLFLPLSNSDTNASVHAATYSGSNKSMLHLAPASVPRVPLLQQLTATGLQTFGSVSGLPNDTAPCIQKIIPAQGPCRGGIEVTLLGYNFRPGLIVKFGAKNALATHCWSESTIVTYLPPSAHAGQVLVSFENENLDTTLAPGLHMVFTYTDDTDRQLIELALQIVGLKMNGKLEDAKNIAKRIVGSDKQDKNAEGDLKQEGSGTAVNASGEPYDQTANDNIPNNDVNDISGRRSSTYQMWYDNAHRAVQTLTRSNLSTEEILINFLSLVDLPNCPIVIPNWNLANTQGHTLMHLACLKNYSKLIAFLISHGTKVNVHDNQGLSPFFLASMCGHRRLMETLLAYRSPWNVRLSNDKYLKDYCDLNVLDVFKKLEEKTDDVDDSRGKLASRSVSTSNNTGNGNNGSGSGGANLGFGSNSNLNGSAYGSGSFTQAQFGHNRRRSSASVDEQLTRSLSVDSLNSINLNSYGRHVSRMITESVSEEREKGVDTVHSTLEIGLQSCNSFALAVTSPGVALSPVLFGNDSDFADSELDSDDDLYPTHHSESDYADYDYDYDDESGEDVDEERAHAELTTALSNSAGQQQQQLSADDLDDASASNHRFQRGLWSKMKRAVFALGPEDSMNLPSYDDLFPFGDGEIRPKLELERALNQSTHTGTSDHLTVSAIKVDDDAGIALDLSEDLALSYINRPRKTVRNDKMLLFFWIPILILISSIFIYVSITGYKVQVIEDFKEKARNTIGNVMVGNERLARVFRKNQRAQLI